MSEMVERVARTICAKLYTGEQEDDRTWHDFAKVAQAVIAAMREPPVPPVHDGSEAAKRGEAVRVLKAAIVDAARSALVTLPWESVAHVIEETGFQLDEHISR